MHRSQHPTADQRHPTADQRRALTIIAKSGLAGCTEHLLLAHSFSLEFLAGLVRDGFASVTPERARAGGKMIVICRLRLTDAGTRVMSR